MLHRRDSRLSCNVSGLTGFENSKWCSLPVLIDCKSQSLLVRFSGDRGCEMAWSLAAIEFVAWSVLEEEGSGQDVADKALAVACEANPFVAWYIGNREVFDQVRAPSNRLFLRSCTCFYMAVCSCACLCCCTVCVNDGKLCFYCFGGVY